MYLRRALIVSALLLLTIFAPFSEAAPPEQPPRWVLADDVRVRSGPSSEHRINGTLPRGAEVILKARDVINGFCFIEGEGHYGYVACQFLSAERVARPRAGQDGVDAAQRWVNGNGVTLRDAPRHDAGVVGRLSLNTIVRLAREDAGGGYCEVAPANGPGGYTACRYLAPTPVVLAHLKGITYGDGQTPRDYDPERVFWLEPSWNALEGYAEYLKTLHPGAWPRNEALEKMKAHLALGRKGPKPPPYADWSSLKRKAAQITDLGAGVDLSKVQDKKLAEDFRRRHVQMQQTVSELSVIGISGEGDDVARVIRLVRALEFPSVQPSLFRSETQVAPPISSTEELSGRFGIVFRTLVSPRPQPKPGTEGGNSAGLYDMLARTQVLVRPVQRIRLFRDGRVRAEASHHRVTETLWRDVDDEECAGWTAGFSFGDADARIWRYFENGTDVETRKESLKVRPAGSLYEFYTTIEMPLGPAKRIETHQTMDRAATGFVGGTYLSYDLDGDGIADLAVWEGEGKGPGHLEGSTTTDDRWYRLVLVNIDGAWKVLGNDQFGYGCGC